MKIVAPSFRLDTGTTAARACSSDSGATRMTRIGRIHADLFDFHTLYRVAREPMHLMNVIETSPRGDDCGNAAASHPRSSAPSAKSA